MSLKIFRPSESAMRDQIEQLINKKRALAEQNKELTQKLDLANKQLSDVEYAATLQREEMQREIDNLKHQLSRKGNKAQRHANQQYVETEGYNKNYKQLQETVESTQVEAEKLRAENHKLQQITQMMRTALNIAEEERNELRKEGDELKREAEANRRAIGEARRRITELEGVVKQFEGPQSNKSSANVQSGQPSLSELDSKLNDLSSYCRNLFQAQTKLQTDNDTLTKNNNDLKATISETNKKNTDLEAKLRELQSGFAGFQGLFNNLQQPTRSNSTMNITYPVVSSALAHSTEQKRIPVLCAKNVADLPDVVDVLNAQSSQFSFYLVECDALPNHGSHALAVTLALCSNDRVDFVDSNLVDTLRSQKGCAEVLVIVLRRGNDPSKFRACHDPSVASGVKNERVMFQLVHFKGKILMDADVNKATIAKFFEYVKMAVLHKP